MLSSLFRSFRSTPQHPEHDDKKIPAVNQVIDMATPHQHEQIKNNSTKNPVLTVQDEEDFSLVQFRPLTYAEVASIATPMDHKSTKISVIRDDELELDDSPSSSYYDYEDDDDQSSKSALSTINMRIHSEFLYGQRGRELMRKHQRWGVNAIHGGRFAYWNTVKRKRVPHIYYYDV